MRLLGLSLFTVGTSACPWDEFRLIVSSLVRDQGTHVGAALVGWHYPARVADLAAIMQAQAVASVLAGKPIEFPMPWDDRMAPDEPIAAEVIDEAREHMKQFSAFAD